MDFYNSNLEVLKEKKRNLYDYLLEAEEVLKTETEYKMCMGEARNKSPIMSMCKGEGKVWLNSQYHPEHEAKMWSEGFSWNGYENVFVMFGLANGYYIRALMREEEVDTIIVYEPCKELFYFVLHHFDMRDILESKKVLLSVEGLGEERFQYHLGTTLTIRNMRMVQRGVYPYYKELFYNSYKKYLKMIGIVDKEKNTVFNTVWRFWESWLHNFCGNLRFMKSSTIFENTSPAFDKNKPVIIVSAGPSVKDELEGLKAAKNHIPIIAVDRIVDFLMEQGIEPDAIFTIDAQYRKALMNVEQVSHIPLIMSVTSSCEITQNHKGKKIWYSDNEFLVAVLRKLGKNIEWYETGTTVSSTAFGTFMGQGYKEIILVGQDLSFDGEFTHAGGVKEEIPYFRKEYMIEGIHGTTVRTRDDWYTMLRWYHGVLEKHQEVTVYDAKTRGAKIQHTINIRLKEFVEQRSWEEKDYRQAIVDLEPTFSEQEWENVVQILREGLEDLKIGKEKATKAIESAQRLIRGVEEHIELTKEDEADLEILQEAGTFLEKHIVFFILAPYIENYTREVEYVLEQKEGDILLESKKVYTVAIIQMQAVQYAVDYYYPKLEQAIKAIEEE